MNVLVRNGLGRMITISTKPTDIIKNLKLQIESATGISAINQRIIYRGKILKDTNSVSKSQIPDNATLTVITPVLGGGKSNANVRGRQQVNKSRELVLNKAGETDYGLVTKMLGNKRVEVIIFSSGKHIQCKIAGHVRTWVTKDDIVLVGLRDFQEDRADVIHKYTNDEARKLMRSGFIPSSLNDKLHNNNESNVDFIDSQIEDREDDGDMKQNNTYEMPPSDTESDEESEEGDADKFINNI
jgi:translation initiation factor 1A